MESDKSEPLQPVPIEELFPPTPLRVQHDNSNKYVNMNKNGQLVVKAWPSAFEILFMCPIFLCIGCCMSTSAHTVFDENDKTVTISNWRGYMCFWPCSSSMTIPYSEVGNIGIRNTGGTEGSQGHEQPIYEVVLVTKSAEVWVIGGQGQRGRAQSEADALYFFLFFRGSDGKPNSGIRPTRTGAVVVPSTDTCC